MALASGTRLGPYEITAQIGVGGMGKVCGLSLLLDSEPDMNLKVLLVLLLLLAQASAQGVAAHHSTPVNFDQSREITIEGVLTEVV